VALDSEAAARLASAGDPVVLVRRDTSTADLSGMAVADGILTTIGSRTSHAAVVARQLNKVCIVGCAAIQVELPGRRLRIGNRRFDEGDYLTLDGSDGRVYDGRIEVVVRRPDELLATVDAWRAEPAAAQHPATMRVKVGSDGGNAQEAICQPDCAAQSDITI
jgi:pyruvate,orthophosphate dikinase